MSSLAIVRRWISSVPSKTRGWEVPALAIDGAVLREAGAVEDLHGHVGGVVVQLGTGAFRH